MVTNSKKNTPPRLFRLTRVARGVRIALRARQTGESDVAIFPKEKEKQNG